MPDCRQVQPGATGPFASEIFHASQAAGREGVPHGSRLAGLPLSEHLASRSISWARREGYTGVASLFLVSLVGPVHVFSRGLQNAKLVAAIPRDVKVKSWEGYGKRLG